MCPVRGETKAVSFHTDKHMHRTHTHTHAKHAVCYKITHLSLSFNSFLAFRSPPDDCFPGLGVAPAAPAVPAPAAAPLALAPPSTGSCWPCCKNRIKGAKKCKYKSRGMCTSQLRFQSDRDDVCCKM